MRADSRTNQAHHFARLIFLSASVPTAFWAGMLAWAQPRYWGHAIGIWATGMVGIVLLTFLRQHRWVENWALLIAVCSVLIVTPELFLRWYGFRFHTGIEFGYPRGFRNLARHRDIFWTLPPSAPGVNSLGFRGKEIVQPKPPGRCRLLFLGDSVPAQGYPGRVERLLHSRYNMPDVESVNLSLAGYSSHQGRVLTEKYGQQLQPDIVVISYGWNDHWLAYGAIDAEKKITPPGFWPDLLEVVYVRLRTLQWVQYQLSSLLGLQEPLAQVRVPIPYYRDNLTRMGTFYTARGARVILLTPPTAHYSLEVPDHLIQKKFAGRKAHVRERHRAYNEVVRSVAAEHAWLVLDLEQEWAAVADIKTLFTLDGIHLSEDGLERISHRIAAFITEQLVHRPHPDCRAD